MHPCINGRRYGLVGLAVAGVLTLTACGLLGPSPSAAPVKPSKVVETGKIITISPVTGGKCGYVLKPDNGPQWPVSLPFTDFAPLCYKGWTMGRYMLRASGELDGDVEPPTPPSNSPLSCSSVFGPVLPSAGTMCFVVMPGGDRMGLLGFLTPDQVTTHLGNRGTTSTPKPGKSTTPPHHR